MYKKYSYCLFDFTLYTNGIDGILSLPIKIFQKKIKKNYVCLSNF